jgi:hypothetical protein
MERVAPVSESVIVPISVVPGAPTTQEWICDPEQM